MVCFARHPNVIGLYDVQLSPGSIFLVLELASGRALFDHGRFVAECGSLAFCTLDRPLAARQC